VSAPAGRMTSGRPLWGEPPHPAGGGIFDLTLSPRGEGNCPPLSAGGGPPPKAGNGRDQGKVNDLALTLMDSLEGRRL
jgi:hypothetical protein